MGFWSAAPYILNLVSLFCTGQFVNNLVRIFCSGSLPNLSLQIFSLPACLLKKSCFRAYQQLKLGLLEVVCLLITRYD